MLRRILPLRFSANLPSVVGGASINATVSIGDVRSPLEIHRSVRAREKELVFSGSVSLPPAAELPSSPIIYSSTTTGQMLYPAEEADVAILSRSVVKYADPRLTEGSVIIRIVRLSDPVTSPVSRVVRNRFFGIRDQEKWTFLAWGLCMSLAVASLGVWQLRRMDYKAKLIERRQKRLNLPIAQISRSPFPWNEHNLVDWEYRCVEVAGVLDHAREMYVGPRATGVPVGDKNYGQVSQPGYAVVTPLMLSDGSTVLVNRGMLTAEHVRGKLRLEDPEWVTVRGILVSGELSGIANDRFRVKNNTTDKIFVYLVPADLAEAAAPRNFSECKLALVNATDVRYHENPRRSRPPFLVKRKADYMCFYADEHMHFNYAMQWFAMSAVFLLMTGFKFAEMVRWRW